MKEEIKQFKKWFKDNHKVITVISVTVIGTVLAIKGYRGLVRLAELQEEATMLVVENNLKLLKDGEVFSMIVDHKTDDFTRTITSKQWVKKNGETLYLGKVSDLIELSEEERITKQLQKISRSITSAVDKLTKT